MIELYKERSYAACIKEGFEFFQKNLKAFVKVMLPYCIIVALLNAASSILSCAMLLQTVPPMLSALLYFLVVLLIFAAAVFTFSRLFLLYRRVAGIESAEQEDGMKKMKQWKFDLLRTCQLAKRSLPFILCMTIAIVLLCSIIGVAGIYAYQAIPGRTAVTAAIAVFIGVVLILAASLMLMPLTYSFYHYMMQKEKPALKTIKQTYRAGRKHLWKIVGVSALAMFILLVLILILQLPELILSQALQHSLTDSVNMGDNVSVPFGGFCLLALASAVMMTFAQLAYLPYYNVLLFLYGDIYKIEELKN